MEIKSYFLKHMNMIDNWLLYAIALDKKILLARLKENVHIDRVYNQMAHQLLEHVDFGDAKNVHLIVDRCKNDLGIREFNEFLRTNLSLVLNLETRLYITHDQSENQHGIQAVDMFCYGIARKYEHGDDIWYNLFKDHIIVEYQF